MSRIRTIDEGHKLPIAAIQTIGAGTPLHIGKNLGKLHLLPPHGLYGLGDIFRYSPYCQCAMYSSTGSP